MKIGAVRFATASLALLVVQLVLVASVAGKYLYQRWTCPRVWTRALAYDPELVMRGRYLSLQLEVNGCQSTLPSGKDAQFPRNPDGTVQSSAGFIVNGPNYVSFPARLVVSDGKLLAIHQRDAVDRHNAQLVSAWHAVGCDRMRLEAPVNFYISEHAQSPLPVKAGDELWIEVTVPAKGPPRPLQLALKQAGIWKALANQ